jgi:6-phosphogluconate dehydrogenase
MTTRLLAGGHRLIVTDRDAGAMKGVVAQGAVASDSLPDLVRKLEPPRAVWIMVPAGDPTQGVVTELGDLMDPEDIIVDGGNSNYKDTMRRARDLEKKGVHYLDVGTSGGIWGAAEGYSMMVGGDIHAIERLRPVLESLAPGPQQGWGRVGASGAGHFVKMVHNGIEYGLMQAYAEGFEVLKRKEEFALDLHQVAEIWRFGSVVRSWLLDLTARALQEDPALAGVKAWVADSGEGRWTVAEAIDLDVPTPVITLSLLMRFVSRQEQSYAAKLLAALRGQFGGHAVRHAD